MRCLVNMCSLQQDRYCCKVRLLLAAHSQVQARAAAWVLPIESPVGMQINCKDASKLQSATPAYADWQHAQLRQERASRVPL